MSRAYERGRLESSAEAPARASGCVPLVRGPRFSVEQILSGALSQPLDFKQEHDEWVVLLSGRARLVVAGEQLELAAGEWLLLPQNCPHTLIETDPGTNWLAVHLDRRD